MAYGYMWPYVFVQKKKDTNIGKNSPVLLACVRGLPAYKPSCLVHPTFHINPYAHMDLEMKS